MAEEEKAPEATASGSTSTAANARTGAIHSRHVV